MFTDFASVEAYLNSLVNYEHTFPVGGDRDWPKLEPTLRAAERLGLSLELEPCIHIAGTKGKGSTLAFLEALLVNQGNVLSFTSPHLRSVKERIRWNGEALPDDLWQEGFEQIVEAVKRGAPIRLSYFETTFILYLWCARELRPDFHLVEVGLGGKWDATNVLQKTVAVITPIDYDHMQVLGNTLTEIASEKAGIIKPRSHVIVSRQAEEARVVIAGTVEEQQARAMWFGEDFGWRAEDEVYFAYHDPSGHIPGLSLGVSGLHQRDNASTAICTARLIAPDLEEMVIRSALAACQISGRQQLLPGIPPVLVDVAHNPISFAALEATLRQQYAGEKIGAVIGMVKDKDARAALGHLQGLVQEMVVVPLSNPRSADPEALARIAVELGFNVRVKTEEVAAFEELHRPGDITLGLVAGSFYLAGII